MLVGVAIGQAGEQAEELAASLGRNIGGAIVLSYGLAAVALMKMQAPTFLRAGFFALRATTRCVQRGSYYCKIFYRDKHKPEVLI